MSTELQPDIVEQIKTAYEKAAGFADIAKANANMALRAAHLCGSLLNQEKEKLEHGEWLGWLGDNCPFICERHAQRFMKLAKTTLVSDLDKYENQKQALIAIGVIAEPEIALTTKGPPATRDMWLSHVSALERAFRESKIDPDRLDDRQREDYIKKLKPVAEFYNKLLLKAA